jgi:phage major head subunit gpT-like protein
MLEQGFNASFRTGLARRDTTAMQIAMTIPSTTAENVYDWLADNFGIREWVGDRVMQNVGKYDYTLKNKDYEGTVKVKRNSIEDDQYGSYGKLFEQMGDSVTQFPDKLLYSVLKAGDSTLCFDGQYFFDVDHPVGLPGKEASVSNHMGGAGAGWYLVDSSKVLKPLIWQPRSSFKMVRMDQERDENVFMRKEYIYGVDGRCNAGFGLWQLAFMSKQDLTSANLKAALTAMASQKGNNGEPLNVCAETLVVPSSLNETALDLVNKEYLANGESNTLRGRFKVVSTGYLL